MLFVTKQPNEQTKYLHTIATMFKHNDLPQFIERIWISSYQNLDFATLTCTSFANSKLTLFYKDRSLIYWLIIKNGTHIRLSEPNPVVTSFNCQPNQVLALPQTPISDTLSNANYFRKLNCFSLYVKIYQVNYTSILFSAREFNETMSPTAYFVYVLYLFIYFVNDHFKFIFLYIWMEIWLAFFSTAQNVNFIWIWHSDCWFQDGCFVFVLCIKIDAW